MQHRDDQPPVSSRPSLLSSEQQAEADRLRAQTKPEFKPAAGASPRRGKGGWIAAGALVALCAGGAVWMAGDADKPVVSADHAAPRNTAANPAAAGASATVTPTSTGAAAAQDADVSVAAILNDTPAQKQETLKEMLSAPDKGEGVKASDRDELNKLLEASPAKEKQAAKLAAKAGKGDKADKSEKVNKADKADKADKASRLASAGQKDKTDKVDKAEKAEKARELKLAARKKEAARLASAKGAPAKAAAQPSSQVDDDVTLLAALVAHSHRENTARAAAARKLKQCKALGADAAEQCRARLCAGSARDVAECKAPRIVKANPVP